MRHEAQCTYVMKLRGDAADPPVLSEIAEYLSALSALGFEVVVLDPSSPESFEDHRRVLRWVARHVPVDRLHDPIREAADAASCECIVLAEEDVRCSLQDLERLSFLLDQYEVVEPHDYIDPREWWSGVDASGALIQRAIAPSRGRSGTVAFQRSAVRALRRGETPVSDHAARRFHRLGAEVFSVPDLFICRQSPSFASWLRARIGPAVSTSGAPARKAFFLSLLPLSILLGATAGVAVAASYLAAVAIGAIALALRGRSGAGAVFPLRACWYAPLWVLERSISMHWALLMTRRVGGNDIASPEAWQKIERPLEGRQRAKGRRLK